jgi:hypothetical protein
MIKFYLIHINANFIHLNGLGIDIQRMVEIDYETFEVIYHPWKLEKLKQK